MTRRNGASQRDRLLAESLPEFGSAQRDLTKTEQRLLQSYAKERGLELFYNAWDEKDTPRRRRRVSE